MLINNPGNPLSAEAANFLAPFNSIFGSIPDYVGPDFTSGFIITEHGLGQEPIKEVKLVGRMMPHQPMEFGGKQNLVKEWYPGNSEPTVQVLGAQEDNVVLKGRFQAKRYANPPGAMGEMFRTIPTVMAEELDGLRKRGNLCRFELGEWVRWGFVEETKLTMRTLADFDWQVSLFIIGEKPPTECKFVEEEFALPLDLNAELINAAAEMEANALMPFEAFSPGLFFEINALIGDVATALSVVTKFVDGVIGAAENAQKLAQKAVGLIKYAQAKVSNYKLQIGALNAYSFKDDLADATNWSETDAVKSAKFVAQMQVATSKPPVLSDAQKAAAQGKASKYAVNASTQQKAIAKAGGKSIDQILLEMKKQFELLAKQLGLPKARHVVKSGDSLETLSMKYYQTVDRWKDIYDHNKLVDTNLATKTGTVLEIPR